MDYLPRNLRTQLEVALSDTPVVCLLGPRQCGKSTLARQGEGSRRYINLDDGDLLRLALADPKGFIDELPKKVTIDEIQRAPELMLAIKRNVDADRQPGRFLLTGSANLLQLPRLADSLAGRMACLYLHPLTESEKTGAAGNFLTDWMTGRIKPELTSSPQPAPSRLPGILVAGGYPEVMGRTVSRAREWQRQYLSSIIERDIRDVAEVKQGGDVARLLAYLSHQTAQLLNVSAVANALGHTRPTIDRYLALLEKLFLIRVLPAWHSNHSKRLVKAPKLHVRDSGLATTLSDLSATQWNEARGRFGHVLESFVIQQLVAMGDWSELAPSFWHYRDKDQVEVDCVIEVSGKVWGVEVKAAASISPTDGKGLLRLAEIAGDRFQGGIVLYDGPSVIRLNRRDDLLAVPLAKLWEL